MSRREPSAVAAATALAGVVVVVVVVAPVAALAYFLPVKIVLGKLDEHLARIADVKVEHDASFYGDAVPGALVTAKEGLACKGGKARRTTHLPEGDRVVVYAGGGAAPVARGPAASASWADPPGIGAFLAMVCGRIGEKTLDLWGVDKAVRSYALYGGDVAYVVGAKPGDAEAPQLWIDKDRFRPLRFSGKGGAGEVRLVDFDSGLTGDLYPRVAAFLDRGKVVARFEVRSIDINRGLAPGDLD